MRCRDEFCVIAHPWQVAVGEDMWHPEVEGARPVVRGLVNRDLERVHAVSSFDAAVCRTFFEAVNLLGPPSSLLSPSMMSRVLTHGECPKAPDRHR